MTDDVSVVPSICVFDVNETLLDIELVAPLFQRLFGDRKVLREWFGQLVLYSNAITLSGPYTTFFTLGQGVLKMLGSIHNVSVQQADIEELRMRMLTMPAHSDVPAGLKQLKDAGFRLVTLTNSPPDSQTSPLKHAGIDGWFEKSFSVDRVRRFKPAPRCTTWSRRSWTCRPPRFAWWRRTCGIPSARKASAARERSSPGLAMLLFPCMGCRNRKLSRPIFRVWPPN